MTYNGFVELIFFIFFYLCYCSNLQVFLLFLLMIPFLGGVGGAIDFLFFYFKGEVCNFPNMFPKHSYHPICQAIVQKIRKSSLPSLHLKYLNSVFLKKY